MRAGFVYRRINHALRSLQHSWYAGLHFRMLRHSEGHKIAEAYVQHGHVGRAHVDSGFDGVVEGDDVVVPKNVAEKCIRGLESCRSEERRVGKECRSWGWA